MTFPASNVRSLNMAVYITIFLWSPFSAPDLPLVNEEDHSITETYFGLNGVIYVKIFLYYSRTYLTCRLSRTNATTNFTLLGTNANKMGNYLSILNIAAEVDPFLTLYWFDLIQGKQIVMVVSAFFLQRKSSRRVLLTFQTFPLYQSSWPIPRLFNSQWPVL